jgi:hypothetical protein
MEDSWAWRSVAWTRIWCSNLFNKTPRTSEILERRGQGRAADESRDSSRGFEGSATEQELDPPSSLWEVRNESTSSTCPIFRLFGNLPKTQIALNSSRSAKAWNPQLRQWLFRLFACLAGLKYMEAQSILFVIVHFVPSNLIVAILMWVFASPRAETSIARTYSNIRDED